MYPIYPIHEETCKPHYGRPVLVVLQDGTRHMGILSKLEGGKLILNEAPEAETKGKKKAKKVKTRASGRKKTANTSEAGVPLQSFAQSLYPVDPRLIPGPVPSPGVSRAGAFVQQGPISPFGYPYNFFGERIAFDVAAIALLFLLFI